MSYFDLFSDLIKQEFGIEFEKQVPPRSGLVPKKVQVRRGGRIFERTQMVRPEETKPTSAGRRPKSLAPNLKYTNLTVPEQHKLRIAHRNLNMPDAMIGVMGGPNREQAKEIISDLERKNRARSIRKTRKRNN